MPELNQSGLGLSFCTQNTDKASVTVDITTEEGVDIVRQLAAEADVFVENFRPGVSERLGLGYDAIGAVRPNVVYVSISAYGQDGPLGHRPAYDHVVQGMAGIMHTTGTDETGPVKVGAPFVDYATGQKAALATVAAVMEQRRTGEAQRVDVAMLDTCLLLMANTLTEAATTGERPAKLGNNAASAAPSAGCFETADEPLMIAANTDRQFRDLCAAIGRPEWAADERFAGARARHRNSAEFRSLLGEVLRGAGADHWEAVFDAAGVPAAKVGRMDEVLAEGQPDARSLTAEVDVAGRPLKLPTAGFKVFGEVPGAMTPPPVLGADTAAVLTELGYTPQDLEDLAAHGVI